MYDLGIIGGQLYIDGNYYNENLYIRRGKIHTISNQLLECREYYYAEGKKVFPGFIDAHVHFELDAGKYKSCDTFYSGSISAAFGGITTFIDFLDPISTAYALEKALVDRRKLAEKSVIDYAFHATLKNPKNEVFKIIKEMERLHLPSVKIFTTYSESGRRTYDAEIKQLLEMSKANKFVVLAHIENDALIHLKESFVVSDLPISRSSQAETDETLKLAAYTKDLDGQLSMVHLSSGKTLKLLKEQYPNLLNKDFWIESCPHYFTFNSNIYEIEEGHLYTMAPPLRSEEENILLNNLINYVDTIGTDHCPFIKQEKNHRELVNIPMGIGGVEHSFNIMYSLFKEKAIDKMTINPAKIHNLYPKKGTLLEGADADIVIYDPSNKHIINEDHSLCDYTVYKGINVDGEIESTISKGHFVMKKRVFLGGQGQYIR